MKSVVLSVAAAWTAPLPSAPAAHPAVPAAYQAAYAAPPPALLRGAAPAFQAPPVFAYAYEEPVAATSSAEMPALQAGAVLAVGAALGYGLGQRRTAALAV